MAACRGELVEMDGIRDACDRPGMVEKEAECLAVELRIERNNGATGVPDCQKGHRPGGAAVHADSDSFPGAVPGLMECVPKPSDSVDQSRVGEKNVATILHPFEGWVLGSAE